MNRGWSPNTDFDELFPSEFLKFGGDTVNDEITLRWSKNHSENYIKIADEYYFASIRILEELLNSRKNNLKVDSWFLVQLFTFRQAIELVLKAKIYELESDNMKIQNTFKSLQHSLSGLFKEVINRDVSGISNLQIRWLEQYFQEIELWDKNSSIFRYSLEQSFFQLNPPEFIDICETSRRLNLAYSILINTFKSEIVFIDEIPKELPSCNFLISARNGLGNFQLRRLLSVSDSFHVIQGYLSASEFLLYTSNKYLSNNFYFPECHLLRHLVELELKQLTNSNYSEIKNLKVNTQSHDLSELWIELSPVIKKLEKKTSDELITFVNGFFKDMEEIDKNGNFFRYPSEYNHQVRKFSIGFNPRQFFISVRAVTNLFEGCNNIISYRSEYELNSLELQD